MKKMKQLQKNKKPAIFNDFTVDIILTYYELMDKCPEYHSELYVEDGVIYYDN